MNDTLASPPGFDSNFSKALGALFDRSSVAVCATDGRTLLYLNDEAARLWRSASIVEMLDRPMSEIVSAVPFDRINRWGAGPVSVVEPLEGVLLCRDATSVPVHLRIISINPVPGVHVLALVPMPIPVIEQPARVGGPGSAGISVTAGGSGTVSASVVRSSVEPRGVDVHSLAERVIDGLDQGVAIVDADSRILWTNPALGRICGAAQGDRLTDLPVRSVDGVESAGLHPILAAMNADTAVTGLMCVLERPGGGYAWLSVGCSPLRTGTEGQMVVTVVDVSERRAVADKMLYAAGHDELTGLPGRALLIERIEARLANRPAGRLCAVLFIDIDRLKEINDTYGHLAGDDVLQACAARLRSAVRRKDVIGRLGGDEFVVMVWGCRTQREVTAIVERLHRRLSRPVVITPSDPDAMSTTSDPDGISTSVSVGASIGVVTVGAEDECSSRLLLAEADRAMYRAKRSGRGRVESSRSVLG